MAATILAALLMAGLAVANVRCAVVVGAGACVMDCGAQCASRSSAGADLLPLAADFHPTVAANRAPCPWAAPGLRMLGELQRPAVIL